MDDQIGGLKERAKQFGMEKIKKEADKRGLGGIVDQAEGFLGLGGQKAAPAPVEAPAQEEAPAANEEASSEESADEEEEK